MGRLRWSGGFCLSPAMAEPEPGVAPDTSMNVASLSVVWFLLRAFRLTASVVSEAIGLSKQHLPKDLWYKYRNVPLLKSEDNVMCKHGRDAEPAVVASTTERTGLVVLESHYRTDPEYPWLGATPDGDIPVDTLTHEMRLQEQQKTTRKRKAEMDIREYGVKCRAVAHEQPVGDRPERALLECKAPYFRPYNHAPIYYVIQTFVQMRVENVKINYLSSYWYGGKCMRIWRVHWSDEVWSWIMQRLTLFVSCVFNDVCPSDTVLPNVYEACQELLDAEFKPAARRRIAKENKLDPNMLIPDIRMDCIYFDEDPYKYEFGHKILKDPVPE